MKRTFPPLYSPSGDPDTDRLAFFHVLERLKVLAFIASHIPTHPHTDTKTHWLDRPQRKWLIDPE